MSTATLQVEEITRADAGELRWLAQELIADLVISFDGGVSDGGTFSDINKLFGYTTALAAIGRDSDIDSETWSPWSLVYGFPQIEPLVEGAAWIEEVYLDCATSESHFADAAERVASARQLLDRLRMLYAQIEGE
jgi:hypothetical protein